MFSDVGNDRHLSMDHPKLYLTEVIFSDGLFQLMLGRNHIPDGIFQIMFDRREIPDGTFYINLCQR
jgi:hypothetical protein